MRSTDLAPAPPVGADTSVLVAAARTRRRRQTFLNALLLLGLVAVTAAGLLLFDQSDRQGDAIDQLVGSLGDVCDRTDPAVLPTDVRADCFRAERGQAPPVVQEGLAGERGTPGGQGIPGGQGGPGGPGGQGLPGEQGGQGGTGGQGGQGLPGDPGAEGAPGVPGQDGPGGADGQSGAPGETGEPGAPPIGWTTTRADGSVESCRRADGFDPASPRYSCTSSGGSGDGGNSDPGGDPPS